MSNINDTINIDLIVNNLQALEGLTKQLKESLGLADQIGKASANFSQKLQGVGDQAGIAANNIKTLTRAFDNLKKVEDFSNRPTSIAKDFNERKDQLRASEDRLKALSLAQKEYNSYLSKEFEIRNSVKLARVQNESYLTPGLKSLIKENKKLPDNAIINRGYDDSEHPLFSKTMGEFRKQYASELDYSKKVPIKEIDAAKTAQAKLNAEIATEVKLRDQLRNSIDNERRVIKPIEFQSLMRLNAEMLISYGIFNQFYSAIAGGSKYILEFNKELIELQAIAQLSNTQTSELEQSFMKLSRGSRFSAVEIAKAGNELSEMGLNASQIKSAITPIIDLAQATGESLTDAVSTASAVITIFNTNGYETAHVSNVLASAINDTRLNIDELRQAIEKSGESAVENGVRFEELVAILAVLNDAGLNAGTGANRLLTELQRPTPKLLTELKNVGLTIADVDVKLYGFTGVMENLAKAGFSGANSMRAFEQRAGTAYIAIKNNMEQVGNLTASFVNTGSAVKASEIQMGNYLASFNKLGNNLGETFKNMSEFVFIGLAKIADSLSGLLGILNDYPNAVKAIGGILVTIFGGATLFAIYKMIGGISILTAGFSALSTVAIASVAAFRGLSLALGLSPLNILAISVGALAVGYELLAGGVKSNSEQLEDATTAYNVNRDALKETEGTLENIGKTIEDVTYKSSQMTEGSKLLGTEVEAIRNRFGDFSEELRKGTINTVEDLIKVLSNLRGEMSQVALEQAGLVASSLRLKIQLSAQSDVEQNKTGKFLSVFNPFAKDPSKATGQFDKLREEQLKNPNEDFYKKFSDNAREISAELKAKQDELVADIGNNNLKKDIENLKNLKARADENVKNINNLNNVDKVRTLGKGQKLFEDNYKLGDYTNNLSSSISSNRSSKNLKGLQDNLSEILKKEKGIKDDTDSKFKEAVKDLNSEQIKAIKSQAINIIEEQKSKITTAISDLTDKGEAKELRTAAKAAADSANDLLSITVQGLKERMRKLKAAIDNAGKAQQIEVDKLDAIINEATDENFGGLYGKYSDQEIYGFNKRKKELSTQQKQAKLDSLTALQPELEKLNQAQGEISKQSRAKAESKIGTSEYGKLQSTYVSFANEELKTEQELNDIINERAKLQNEINAANGISLEANKPTMQQLGEILSEYGKKWKDTSNKILDLRDITTGSLNSMRGGFSNFIFDVVKGTKSISSSFKDMAASILESMLRIASDSAAKGLLGGALSLLGSALGGTSEVYGPNLPNVIIGKSLGGYIPGFAQGGYLDFMDMGRDSKITALRGGEYVLNPGATKAVGKDVLDSINFRGNSFNPSNTVQNNSYSQPTIETPAPINIYVVSPENRPSLTARDVLVVVDENIAKGGSTAKLIKTIIR